MIQTRNDDDQPDVIDLTISYGFYGSFNYPIRPPSPFADYPIQPQILSQNNEDHDTNEIVDWSPPTRELRSSTKTNKSENMVYSSARSLSSQANNAWRRTLNKLLKRTKSNKHKKVVSQTTSDVIHPYDFGAGEITPLDSVTSRNNNKRVHWIDDDEIILNACHRFVEYLKLFVQNILDDTNEDDYLKHCQISLDELDSLIDCQKIKQAFEDLIQLVEEHEKNQLYQQQTYIENLISRTVLFSSA